MTPGAADPRRLIPGVDQLLEHALFGELLESFPRGRVVSVVRTVLDSARARAGQGQPIPAAGEVEPYAKEVRALLELGDVPSLRGVINATGVVLHTNLGRAPLAESASRAMATIGVGYSNLEFDLEEGRRGSRYEHCAALIREVVGSEDALVVNNAAAALVLAMNTLALGREVVVSRGELVEIGGGFRIPDMLERAGASLREVGSTNRTRIDDYRAALGDATTILKVHRSNFRISGFTEEAPLGELAELAKEQGLHLIYDLGSGLLVDPAKLGLPDEPTAQASLRAGAHVVVFSGDKLLGGPQAGIIAGSTALVRRLRENPLCRALRVDKVTLAGLEATLRLYRNPERVVEEIPTLRMIRLRPEDMRVRVQPMVEALGEKGVSAEAVDGVSMVGGGTYPGVELETVVLRIGDSGTDARSLALRLRGQTPPVVARVEDDALVLDLRTVAPERDAEVLSALGRVCAVAQK